MTPKLLTPDETADILHVSPDTLAVWRSTGRYNLPFIKSGRRVFYDEVDVFAFISGRKQVHTGLAFIDNAPVRRERGQ